MDIAKKMLQGTTSRSLVILLAAWTCSAHAALHDLSDAPLFVVEGVDPNIILTMDDSGSMEQSNMPDSIVSLYNNVRALSSSVNKIYYDPEVTYVPPVDEDGISLGDADFNNAWSDGYDQSGTCTVNLATSYQPTWDLGNNCDSTNTWNGSFYGWELIGTAQAAYYYQFDASNSSCDGTVDDDDCFDKVTVSASTAPSGVDGYTNFANWYSYYRKRMYLAKAAVSLSFANFGDDIRIGYQRINNTSLNGVDPFTGSDRASFYSWLFNVPTSGGTPLRQSLKRVGDYFSTAAPYRDDPDDSSSPELSCRQNFHILVSDGYWNGSTAISGNKDNQTHTLPSHSEYPAITSYSPRAPYKDSNSSYLADNAFYYWYTDLRPSLDNNVPPNIDDTSTDIDNSGGDADDSDIFWNPVNDPAEWQHMVNFTIGLGVQGVRDYPDDYEDLLDGTLSWPNDEIDDLWHAAINSRGRYLSAQNSQQLVDAFDEVVNRITETTGSYAPVALNTGTVSSGSAIFFSQFETNKWIGHLLARPISDGTNCGLVPAGDLCDVSWDAACELTGGACTATSSTSTALSPGSRVIITKHASSGDGIPFRWTSLAGSQQSILRDPDGTGPEVARADPYGEDRLDYLRGDRSNEISSGGEFRNRQSVLGDTIGSPPLYVGSPNRFYPGGGIPELTTGTQTYAQFRSSNSSREPMVYIGANDGMLHGFRASDGQELLAYIPGEVFDNIGELSRTDYSHINYVDGPLVENDVYYSSAWHSVMVGGLGLGGQGYFALDITSPGSFSEANASSIALWEFTDDDDADMGYTYGRPSIVRMANGKWAAVFGNGINNTKADGAASSTGNAVVFIVDIQDGSLIKKLDTGIGFADDPEGNSRPNGIVGIFTADLEGDDFIVDRIYATDMFGNVWAFDVSDSNISQWKSAYKSGTNPVPLYTAVNSSGGYQPITSPPVVIKHPQTAGAMVLFGTGQYLGVSDLSDTSEQTYYGIYDNFQSGAGSGRSRLIEQTITLESAPGTLDARTVSDNGIIKWDDGKNPVDSDEKLGWFIDLPESGERVYQRSVVRDGRVIFRTVTPSDDRCDSGGSSWLMELDAVDGSRLNFTVFDYTRDQNFDSSDLINSLHGSGIRDSNEDVNSEPSIIQNPDGQTEIKFYTGSDGQIRSLDENNNLNRQTPWRQIR